ncbi:MULTISPECIES: restriction endonuclease [Myxococcus]|uniref:restriction endonuclease n=1 Tax=Myxococcus TaxID=32 RepID=UPI001142A115|nr:MULTISPECIES: restriction endonuclease [Myxococcus]NOK01002.1 restriction endonuclease [Myxococcus xanthus]
MKAISRGEFSTTGLFVDAHYEGGRRGNAGDDPLPALLGVSNQGGFRHLGTIAQPRLIVITSTGSDPDWPDELDQTLGIFTYFGDNKRPGRELHETPRWGNEFLRKIFNAAHTGARHGVPPILVFTRTATFRDLTFRGLAVPGADGLSQNEDLVAVWKIANGQRFQNYRAKFTILDVPHLTREWLNVIRHGGDIYAAAPKHWQQWVNTGKHTPLRAERSRQTRSKTEQLPNSKSDLQILADIRNYFSTNPVAFEACAAELARMTLGRVPSIDLTRPSRDGGRDAVGKYQIGEGQSSILVDFALEAKCYAENNSVGVREISRIISRLRHRQFGILATTSYVHNQAYQEIMDDGHPIIIMAGRDIVEVLRRNGFSTRDQVLTWLKTQFP